MSFFTALRRAGVSTEPPVPRVLAAPTGPAAPDTPPRPTPAWAQPSRPSPAPVLRAWADASFGAVEQVTEERVLDDLADLTGRLGSPLAAAQHLYAPHLRKDHRDA